MGFRRYAPVGRTGLSPTADNNVTGDWDFGGNFSTSGANTACFANTSIGTTGLCISYNAGAGVARIDSRHSGGPYGLGDLIIAADDVTWAGVGTILFSSLGNATFGAGAASTLTLPGGTVDLQDVGTTGTAPGAGGAGALPATPAGYVSIDIGGVTRQIAYY